MKKEKGAPSFTEATFDELVKDQIFGVDQYIVKSSQLVQIKVIKERHLMQIVELEDRFNDLAIGQAIADRLRNGYVIVGKAGCWVVVKRFPDNRLFRLHQNTMAKYLVESSFKAEELEGLKPHEVTQKAHHWLQNNIPQLFTE
jgi:hypothetical protein